MISLFYRGKRNFGYPHDNGGKIKATLFLYMKKDERHPVVPILESLTDCTKDSYNGRVKIGLML